jgi:DNA-binding transcriptional LysR family regulator
MSALEKRLGTELLVRSSTGVRPTEAGTVLLNEARAVLARYDQAMTTFARHRAGGEQQLRLGVPLELPPDLLTAPIAGLAAVHPTTTVTIRHLSTAGQLAALRGGELDVGLVRERPMNGDLDATLIVEEPLGVLLASTRAEAAAGTSAVSLAALSSLTWLSFPREGSPAWYDEVRAILRSHGVEPGPAPPAEQELIAEVKFAAVSAGTAFALAPEGWAQPVPGTVTWLPLTGRPLVRRTWVAWPAESRRRDIGYLVAALENHSH